MTADLPLFLGQFIRPLRRHGSKYVHMSCCTPSTLGLIRLFSPPAVLTDVDYNTTSTVWAQDKWKGVFRLKWIYIKDIPSMSLLATLPLNQRADTVLVIAQTARSATSALPTRPSRSP